jgi:cytochrome c
MKFRMTRQMAYWMLGASALALAACGGSSEPEGPTVDAPPAAETSTADEAHEAAEEAAETTGDTAEETADSVEEALEDAADTIDEATEELQEAAEDAVDAAGDLADAASWEPTDKVSAEDIAEYVALTGDADAGRRVFTRCMSCHVIAEGQNRVGPSLYGVVGREAGGVENFRYSEANSQSHLIWTEPALYVYLENPREYLPGTTMAFPGLPRAQERADVIAFIKRESGQE